MSKKLIFYKLKKFEKNTHLRKACWILTNCYSAVSYFHEIYKILRKKEKGGTTAEQQNLLRAMLLFSAAGLDAVVKQVIRDSLEMVISKDSGAKEMFKSYVESRIKKVELIESTPREVVTINTKFLSEVLTDNNPQKKLIIDMVDKLTGDSLQSVDQLLRIAAYFAIPREKIIKNLNLAKDVFIARNQITHEMDVNLEQIRCNRRQRSQKDMALYTNTINEISWLFIENIFKKIST